MCFEVNEDSKNLIDYMSTRMSAFPDEERKKIEILREQLILKDLSKCISTPHIIKTIVIYNCYFVYIVNEKSQGRRLRVIDRRNHIVL